MPGFILTGSSLDSFYFDYCAGIYIYRVDLVPRWLFQRLKTNGAMTLMSWKQTRLDFWKPWPGNMYNKD